MSIERMCELGQVSRAGWYRQGAAPQPGDHDLKLRDEIQKITLEWAESPRSWATPRQWFGKHYGEWSKKRLERPMMAHLQTGPAPVS